MYNLSLFGSRKESVYAPMQREVSSLEVAPVCFRVRKEMVKSKCPFGYWKIKQEVK